MKNPRRILWLVLTTLGVALLAVAWHALRAAGSFTRVTPTFAGRCNAVEIGASAEDIQIDRQQGFAYLSHLNRAAVDAGEDVYGTIMLMDLNIAKPRARAAMRSDPNAFRPLGISLWQSEGAPARMFAVSLKAHGKHTVEIAEHSSSGFVPVATIGDELFFHPNTIAAVSATQFYLLNDTRAEGAFDHFIDALLQRGSGTLVYYDGKIAREVDSKLRLGTGMALSPDHTRLYVSEAAAKRLRVYRRDTAHDDLTLEEIVPLAAAPDNLNVDDDGVVWVAAHPKLLAFLSHKSDPLKRAPTQVLRFDPRGPKPAAGENDTRITTLYVNAGEEISAGSVAAAWRGQFLIGALYDHKVLICNPNP